MLNAKMLEMKYRIMQLVFSINLIPALRFKITGYRRII